MNWARAVFAAAVAAALVVAFYFALVPGIWPEDVFEGYPVFAAFGMVGAVRTSSTRVLEPRRQWLLGLVAWAALMPALMVCISVSLPWNPDQNLASTSQRVALGLSVAVLAIAIPVFRLRVSRLLRAQDAERDERLSAARAEGSAGAERFVRGLDDGRPDDAAGPTRR